MAEQSSMHFYLNWAKERIDAMDATLASLEAKAGEMQAKVKANPLVIDLKNQRDAFQETVKQQAKAGEAAWQRAKAQWEPQWNSFEAQMKTYIDTASKQIEQQAKAGEAAWQRTKTQLEPHWTGFEAQMKPYIEAASKQIEQQAKAGGAVWERTKTQLEPQWNSFEAQMKTYMDTATKFAAGRRAELEASVRQMRADAETDARMQKLKQAGAESWTMLNAAMAESRKAFDRANQATWDALKRVAPPKT